MTEPDVFVKVRFRLQQDEDGWPPVSSKGMWAELVDENVYRIDNTPGSSPTLQPMTTFVSWRATMGFFGRSKGSGGRVG